MKADRLALAIAYYHYAKQQNMIKRVSMNTYHIYIHGKHVDTINAYTPDGAVIHYLDDNHSVDRHDVEVLQVYVW